MGKKTNKSAGERLKNEESEKDTGLISQVKIKAIQE